MLDTLGRKEDLKGQISVARGYGRFSHRIKGNGREGQARISGRRALKQRWLLPFCGWLPFEPGATEVLKKRFKGTEGVCGKQLHTLNPRHLEGAELMLQSERQGLCSSAARKAGMPTLCL